MASKKLNINQNTKKSYNKKEIIKSVKKKLIKNNINIDNKNNINTDNNININTDSNSNINSNSINIKNNINNNNLQFGNNPTFTLGLIYNNKFITTKKGYQNIIDLENKTKYMPAIGKFDGKMNLFFQNRIFNTYVLSVEENVSTLYSFDKKVTIINKLLNIGEIYVVKVISDEKIRVVELIEDIEKIKEIINFSKNNLLEEYIKNKDKSYKRPFPGMILKAEFKKESGKVKTIIGEGNVLLQNNTPTNEMFVVLYSISHEKLTFAQIGAPIDYCTVNPVIQKSDRIIPVSNGNVRGVLVNASKPALSYDVVVQKALLGSYIFSEGIRPGLGIVKIIEISDDFITVLYNNKYTGIFYNELGKPYRKNQKIRGNILPEINLIGDFKYNFIFDISDKNDLKESDELINEKIVKVDNKKEIVECLDDGKLENYDKNELSKLSTNSDKLKFINKYISIVPDKIELIKEKIIVLSNMGELNIEEVKKILRYCNSKNIGEVYDCILEQDCNLDICMHLFKVKNTKNLFIKILIKLNDNKDLLNDRQKDWISQNKKFLKYSIEFIYNNIKNPGNVIRNIFNISKENTNLPYHTFAIIIKYDENKRELYEQALKCHYNKDEMKVVLNGWYDYEKSVGGDIERVKEMAKAFKNN